MNTRTSLITVTSLTATFVALCAAVFSVTGIAKLFAGAALSVAIMASALELGKIVSISFLDQYWTDIPKALKYYLESLEIEEVKSFQNRLFSITPIEVNYHAHLS